MNQITTLKPGFALQLPFDVVHKFEKNPDGQKHLTENLKKFNADGWQVLKRMMNGERLNHPQCTKEEFTLSLSSRISELRKSNYKVDVSKEWFVNPDTGKKIYKEYFLKPLEITRIQKLIIDGLNFVKFQKVKEAA